jgi:glucose/arabinose dehydrogenase
MGDGGSAGDPGNRAQNLDSLLGKMLRIDVNGTSAGRPYRIPASNPYVGRAGRDEIWSRGLRNPWSWSFDRLKGDLWIGDVGQNRYEEIDRSTVTENASRGRGVNYGWRVMEGRHCYRPSSGCSTAGKILPVVEYSHSQGCSVTGGYVYRGARSAKAPAAKTQLMDTAFNISGFGEDQSGELYVVDHGGALYRFEAP